MNKTFKSVFPFTQETVAEYECISGKELDKKLTDAEAAFKKWRKTNFSERSALMLQLADKLIENKEQFAKLITMEMGKVYKESEAEIEKCAACCRYYANHAEQLLRNIDQPSDASKSFVQFDPVGIILAIMPWNFPFWQVFRFAAPYIMAGNVSVLKHAPNVCGVSLAIERLFLEAGFPQHIFQSLIIDTDLTEKIIEHPAVQGITLTGSERAGSVVGALAGKAIKKSVLELGGSDALIVLEDADIEKAAKVAVTSRMQNAGQSCIAAKRFITVGRATESFTAAIKKEIEKLKTGNPFDAATTTGPIARIDLAEHLEQQLQNSLRKGALLILGGTRSNCIFEPTLLTGVAPGMPSFDEEIFGPVASVIAAKDNAHAIELANASSYGLGASIWTNDVEKAAHLSHELEAGAVFINALVKSDPRYPFGGIKRSGYGRELSYFGIHEFMNIKTVFIG